MLCVYKGTWPNFIELLSTTICLAWNFCLDMKNRITNKISICCVLLVTGIQLLFAYPENHFEIWLLTLFLYQGKNFMLRKISLSCPSGVSSTLLRVKVNLFHSFLVKLEQTSLSIELKVAVFHSKKRLSAVMQEWYDGQYEWFFTLLQ